MKAFAMTALGGIAAAITLSGCAAINKTRPADMTVAEHEQAAAVETKKAEIAARARGFGRTEAYAQYSAERHRKLAGEHASAAERRRAEVANACTGVESTAAFTKSNVKRVQAIREPDPPREYYPYRLRGARVTVVAPASVSEATHLLTCEAARESAGLAAADTHSPLAVETARATAVETDAGVVIEIRSPYEDDAAEILRRAEALASKSP